MSAYGNTAITFGSLKSAVLYFDQVVPVNLGLEVMPRKGESKHPGPLGLRPLPNLLREMLPPDLLDNPAFIDRLAAVNGATSHLVLKLAGKQFGFAPRIGDLSEEEYEAVEDTAASAFYEFIGEFHLEGLPLDCGGGVPSDEPESETEAVISLACLDLIDAERIPWEQIREFRRDVQARDKLRRLRLFAYENYKGKSRDFVEDDILTRVADYEAAVQQWGFETAQGGRPAP